MYFWLYSSNLKVRTFKIRRFQSYREKITFLSVCTLTLKILTYYWIIRWSQCWSGINFKTIGTRCKNFEGHTTFYHCFRNFSKKLLWKAKRSFSRGQMNSSFSLVTRCREELRPWELDQEKARWELYEQSTTCFWVLFFICPQINEN